MSEKSVQLVISGGWDYIFLGEQHVIELLIIKISVIFGDVIRVVMTFVMLLLLVLLFVGCGRIDSLLLTVIGTFSNQLGQADPLLTHLLSVAVLDGLEIVPFSTRSARLLEVELHLCVGRVLAAGRGVLVISAGDPSLGQWPIIVRELGRSLGLYPDQLATLIVHHKLQLVVLGGVRLEVKIVALA